MKVLHLAKSDSDGGAAKAGFRIHRGLCGLGIESKMFVGHKQTEDASVEEAPRLQSFISQKLDRLVTRMSPRTSESFRSAGVFGVSPRGAIQKFNPDILQLHWINRGFLRLESLYGEKRPIVWRLADLWPVSGSEHYPENMRRVFEGYLTSNTPAAADGIDFDRKVWERKKRVYESWRSLTIVAPTSWMAKMCAQSPLLKNRKIEVISTGQDLKTFYESNRRAKRSQYQILEGTLVLGFGAQGGVHDKRKGFGFLVDALNRAMKQNCFSSPPVLLIFGSDVRLHELEELQEQVGCRVVNLGVLQSAEELRNAYSMMDVFYVPSIFENLANTAIEAMACGTPVACFNVGGMPDLVDHQKSGFLAGEPSIQGLIESFEWAKSLSIENRAHARARVESKFTLERQAQSFKELYLGLLKTDRAE